MRSNRFRFPGTVLPAVVLLVSGAAHSLLADQAPAPEATSGTQPPAASAPAGTSTPQPQRPTFAVEINLVTTDVIARGRNGQFIADLDKSEFQVLEDGVPQEVTSFVLVHGGRVFNQQLPPPPPTPEGIILPPTRPTNDSAGRIFVLFVDDLHLEFRNTGRIRELFKKMSKTLIHDGDLFGIVSTGPSSLSIDMTYDKKRLDEAINRITGSGLKPTDILQAPEGSQGPQEVRYRAHVAFKTAYELLQNLERVQNRRKALIYVSDGYDFNPFEKTRNSTDAFFGNPYKRDQMPTDPDTGEPMQEYRNPFDNSGAQFADADLAGELNELTRAANRANASFYTIDPRGLVGGPDIDEQIDPMDWSAYVRKSQDSLRVLAEQTGGIAVVNQNDFDKALKRIDAETSDYYVLGYYSSNPDPTRRTRKLEVKVSRDGVDVWSRSSYSMRLPSAK
jgi:VWFA-related protein